MSEERQGANLRVDGFVAERDLERAAVFDFPRNEAEADVAGKAGGPCVGGHVADWAAIHLRLRPADDRRAGGALIQFEADLLALHALRELRGTL